MNKLFLGIVVGLMFATSVVYLIETIEEFGEGDMIKGPFFLIVTVAYFAIAIWMIQKETKLSHIITIAGSVSLVVLYVITRVELSMVFNIDDASPVSELGIFAKTLQIGIIGVTSIALIQLLKK